MWKAIDEPRNVSEAVQEQHQVWLQNRLVPNINTKKMWKGIPYPKKDPTVQKELKQLTILKKWDSKDGNCWAKKLGTSL